MRLLLIFSIISFFLLVAFPQEIQPPYDRVQLLHKYNGADSLYRKAENFVTSATYTEEKEIELNKKALSAFETLLPYFNKNERATDSLAFYVHFKMGIINHFFENFTSANNNYQYAIDLQQKLPGIADSILFKIWLYKGIIYNNKGIIDSASVCYRNAEKIAASYKESLSESERLYNNLGTLYHETGNFTQAKNYFEKAAAILPKSSPYYQQLLINYKTNLASSLIRLEQYEKAAKIYQSILPLNENANKNEIIYNLATIKLNTGAYQNAINFFKQTNYEPGKRVRVYAYMGLSFYKLGLVDSAKIFLDKAEKDFIATNNFKNNIPYGLVLKFKGDILSSEKKFAEAILLYQRSLTEFYPGFRDSSLLNNPVQFSGIFSYINLFNTLIAKADALELLHQEKKDVQFLESSLNAYQSAFQLADYVEKTYDSDEARLFLGKIKYTIHNKAINVCLSLYNQTHKKNYLEQAYVFGQQNKASVLSLNVLANELKKVANNTNDIFEKETLIKSSITRLSLKSAQLTDSLQQQSINSSIRDYEIQLGKLQEKIKEDPAYKNKYFASQIPSIKNIQYKLDKTSAILSFHLSGKELILFSITHNNFDYYSTPVDSIFFTAIEKFKTSLHYFKSEQRYNGATPSLALYKKIIAPIELKLSDVERLIIIPDNELNYLPFEALQDEKGNYLIEKYSIQYQYSTTLLGNQEKVLKPSTLLAFAPFASQGYQDTSGNRLSSLPASKEEVENLRGTILTDSNASKNNFLSKANHYSLLHLATHASVNNENPQRSFIAFYPTQKNNGDDYKLYAQEIYNLQLDSTRLIILSACETGTGQLVKGEGLMSLSRAFAYAGCPNIITSLWKAEDKTTALITQKLHQYLKLGYTNDIALQKAKLDLLKDTKIDPRYKNPNYWAHLIFIGNYEPHKSFDNWKWMAVVLILSAILFVFTKRKTWLHLARLVPQRNK